jgi:transposase
MCQIPGTHRLFLCRPYAHKAVTRHRGCLLAATGETGTEPAPASVIPPDALLDEGGKERPLAARTRERYADIRARLDAGHSQAEIIRATGLAPKTVRRFARAGSAAELLGGTARGSSLDQFKPYLCRRWNEGARDGAALHAEIRRQGWAGSARTVRRYLAQFREPGAAHEAPPAVPKARQITRLLLTRPDHLDAAEREQLAQIRAACPHIDALAGHVTAFAEMMAGLTGATCLDPWLDAVEATNGQPELRSFANGIRHDKEAVLNGLTLACNSGMVEGIVNKIKAVKRQMFGRASFALLRKRMIMHPA